MSAPIVRVGIVALALAALACSIGETSYESVTTPLRVKKPSAKTCDSPFLLPDTSTLEACGDGKGHCYDGSKTAMAGLPACKGEEVCIPDAILTSNGAKLKTCAFFIDQKPGVCLSVMVPDVGAHADQLQKDVCKDDERCVPCIDPTNGKDTHICDPQGVHEKACVGGANDPTPKSCCHGAGTCLNEDGVPSDSRDQMHRDTCGNKQLCAPASMVDGKSTSCSALGLSGVCIDTCFAAMLRPSTPVMRGDCGPTEVCLPCVIGAAEGAPGC